jgi:hypothetical protein
VELDTRIAYHLITGRKLEFHRHGVLYPDGHSGEVCEHPEAICTASKQRLLRGEEAQILAEAN